MNEKEVKEEAKKETTKQETEAKEEAKKAESKQETGSQKEEPKQETEAEKRRKKQKELITKIKLKLGEIDLLMIELSENGLLIGNCMTCVNIHTFFVREGLQDFMSFYDKEKLEQLYIQDYGSYKGFFVDEMTEIVYVEDKQAKKKKETKAKEKTKKAISKGTAKEATKKPISKPKSKAVNKPASKPKTATKQPEKKAK